MTSDDLLAKLAGGETEKAFGLCIVQTLSLYRLMPRESLERTADILAQLIPASSRATEPPAPTPTERDVLIAYERLLRRELDDRKRVGRATKDPA